MLTMAIPDVEILAVCSLLVRNMVLIYSPAGTNFYSSRGGEFERIWSV